MHGDAIILGVWSVTGCVKALVFDMPLVSAVFMGVLTAVGGGMIRDVVTGQIPSIFGGGTLYAVPATISAGAMTLFYVTGHQALGMIISPIIGGGLVILAYWKGVGPVPQQRVGAREYDRGATPGTRKTAPNGRGWNMARRIKKENRGRVLTEIPSRRSVAYIS